MKILLIALTFLQIIQLEAKPAPVSSIKSLTFFVKTNMSGFSFEGHLTDSQRIDEKDNAFILTIEPKALTTDMSLRDEHMREQIFKNSPIIFEGQALCEESCVAKGKLTIANTSKTVEIPLVKKSNNEFQLKHKILLSDFGIERPAFMGVKVNEHVEVDITFN